MDLRKSSRDTDASNAVDERKDVGWVEKAVADASIEKRHKRVDLLAIMVAVSVVLNVKTGEAWNCDGRHFQNNCVLLSLVQENQ